jgi:hypothetical protein
MRIHADLRRAGGNQGRFSMFSAVKQARSRSDRLTDILEIL